VDESTKIGHRENIADNPQNKPDTDMKEGF